MKQYILSILAALTLGLCFSQQTDAAESGSVVTDSEKHTVTVSIYPNASAGTVNTDMQWESYADVYTTITARPNSDYVFKCWKRDGEIVSEDNFYYFYMPAQDVNLTAVFEYQPANPLNPGANAYDADTHTLTIDDFTTNELGTAINEALVSYNLSQGDVEKIVVWGTVTDLDFCRIDDDLPNCTILDFSHTDMGNVGSYSYMNNTTVKTVILPASITYYNYYAFNGCSALRKVVMYAEEPAGLDAYSFRDMTPAGVTLYVPDDAVEAYRANEEYCTKFVNILPISRYNENAVPACSNVNFTLQTTDTWNDITAVKSFLVTGTYTSSLKKNAVIKYSVDGGDWITATEYITSGADFDFTAQADFSKSGYATHTLRVVAVDADEQYSDVSQLMFYDISKLNCEVSSVTYDGTEKTPDVHLYTPQNATLTAGSDFAIAGYSNNVNAGYATVSLKGIYPTTVGTRDQEFYICEAPLYGTITLEYTECDYDGTAHTPAVTYVDDNYTGLVEGVDYKIGYYNNVWAGSAYAYVEGIGNYTNSHRAFFTINHIDLKFEDLSITYPEKEVVQCSEGAGISVTSPEGAGWYTVTYTDADGNSSTSEPTDIGTYTISLSFAQGSGYNAAEFKDIYTFSIIGIADDEWTALQAIYNDLDGANWTNTWDLSAGKASVPSLYGVTVRGGHVTEIQLYNNGLKGCLTDDAHALKYLGTLNVNGNTLTGDLGKIGSLYPAITRLEVANNHFAEVSGLLPATLNYISIYPQTVDETVMLDLTSLKATLQEQFPSILLYYSYGNDFLDYCHVTVKPEGYDNFVLNFADDMSFTTSPYYCYYGKSGDVVSAQNDFGNSFNLCIKYAMGDADFDGCISATDLQSVINYAFEQSPKSMFNFTAADTYADNNINVQDVVCLVNLLLDSEEETGSDDSSSSSSDSSAKSRIPQTHSDRNADTFIYVRDGKLILSSARDIAALDIHLNYITGNVSWHITELGMMASTKNDHAVAYSLTGKTIPAGETILADVSGSASVAYASLADSDAKKIDVVVNADATAIYGIAADGAGRQVYNIAGQRTDDAQKGVNIVSENGVTKKVFINK